MATPREIAAERRQRREAPDFFGSVRPAASMVGVAARLDPRWRVEIEADAVVG